MYEGAFEMRQSRRRTAASVIMTGYDRFRPFSYFYLFMTTMAYSERWTGVQPLYVKIIRILIVNISTTYLFTPN